MINQAVALLVHDNPDQVNALIRILARDFDIYVHIDKKSTIDPAEIANSNTWKEVNVKWGGYGMVEATAFLYKQILASTKPYSHIILLSGDTLPVKSNEYIKTFLNSHKLISFIENEPAKELHLDRRRLIYYNEDLKKRYTGFQKLNQPFKILRWLQKKLNIKRSIKGFERTGSQWTILARPHVRHLLTHCNFKDYKTMAVPDESFVQNHFTNYNLTYRDNLIYAEWPEDRSHSPGFINHEEYTRLVKGPYLFARKFETSFRISSVQDPDSFRAFRR